jgi:hypothetical protein
MKFGTVDAYVQGVRKSNSEKLRDTTMAITKKSLISKSAGKSEKSRSAATPAAAAKTTPATSLKTAYRPVSPLRPASALKSAKPFRPASVLRPASAMRAGKAPLI